MSLEIIGAESLGVRSLCCLVTLPDRLIVIDPGVSLGYVRHGQNKAVVALANKLARIAWVVTTQGGSYEPRYLTEHV